MTLNPWKALREAQAKLDQTKENLSIMDSECAGLRIFLQEAQLRHKLAEAHIINLNKQLDKAHFRNPETGCIGPKGKRF